MRSIGKAINLILNIAVVLFALCLSDHKVMASVIPVDEACSLHDAIAAANRDEAVGGCPAGAGADTIYLTGDVTLSEMLPIIDSVISIDGDGFTISGDKRFPIFRVGAWPYGSSDPDAESKLTINRLTVAKGRADHGSALYVAIGAEVNIYESHVRDNYARIGGAIFNWGQLNIAGSSFSNNLAWDSGGAIENHGTATLEIRNSVFSNNSAGYQGGAIFSSAPAKVRTSSFVRNAALEGGAVFSYEDELSVVNSTFSHNTGADSGGALYLQQSIATLTHLTVYGNESRDGGGIFQDAGSVSLFNSIIGGSIDAGDCVGAFSENRGNLIEDGSCEPAYSGSPLLQPLSGSPAHHRLTARSQANGNGEVEYCEGKDQLGNIRQASYHCDIGAVERKGESEAVNRDTETAPPSEEPKCTLADQILAANRDETAGACPAGRGVDTIRIDGDITLKARLPKITSEIIILGNGHTVSGDYNTRIFDIGDTGHLTIHNLKMIRGSHAVQGGAIRLLGGTLKICNSTIRDSHTGYGGAIYSEHGTVEIENSELSANSAHFGGGAIASEDASSLAIANSIISNNVARAGGALSPSDGTLTLINSTVSHNSAHYGGAIYSSGGHPDSEILAEDNTLAIIDSTVSHNSATHFGGAINNSSKKLTIFGGAFSDNEAGIAGGALIMVHGTLIAENSSFVNNAAEENGGAIYSESAEHSQIFNSTFSGNSAEDGGALMVGNSTLTHVTIANNVANEAGGISMYDGVILRSSILANNSAGDCRVRSEYTQRIDVTSSLIGDASCDAELSGDPLLGDLRAERSYHPLLENSPAIDVADPQYCPPTDQLGNPRPQGDGCDIGAIEYMGE